MLIKGIPKILTRLNAFIIGFLDIPKYIIYLRLCVSITDAHNLTLHIYLLYTPYQISTFQTGGRKKTF